MIAALTAHTFERDALFGSEERRELPDRSETLTEIRDIDAEIVVVVAVHGLAGAHEPRRPELPPAQRSAALHVIVVESSGRRDVIDQIVGSERVSRILLQNDEPVRGRQYGVGSYGMSVSAQIGLAVGHAPRVFFSHSDMVALYDGFLSWLRSKLTDDTRLGGFTARGIIPFSGGMLVERGLLEEPGLDGLPIDPNPFAPGTPLERVLPLVYTNSGVDSGEQYI